MLRVWLVPSVKRKGERRRGGERAQMHVVDGVLRAIAIAAAVPLFLAAVCCALWVHTPVLSRTSATVTAMSLEGEC